MLTVAIEKDAVRIGPHWAMTFHRTLRIPDDGRDYPLPPGMGRLPVFRVADYQARLPASWRSTDGLFIALYQREALWLGFHGPDWRAQAVKLAVGGINALSGRPETPDLSNAPQDYIVCPDQPWLDGTNTGHGRVRQFVAMPLGKGYTIEADLAGREVCGGFQLTVYEPLPGKFPEEAPRSGRTPLDVTPGVPPRPMAASVMGIGAGGQLRQKIYPDPYGIATWDPANKGRVVVNILNSRQFSEVTGQVPPPSPIDAATYAACGLPWFARYDDAQADIAPSRRMAGVKTIAAHDAERKPDGDPEPALEIDRNRICIIGGYENQDG
jgi:hypothetical protein